MTEQQAGEIWTVEAAATLQSLLEDPECPELLCRALTGSHGWQLRNETTVFRALNTSHLVPQWLAALLTLGATVTVEGGGGSERSPEGSTSPLPRAIEASVEGNMPLQEWLEQRVKGRVTALHIPAQGSSTRWGVARVGRTSSDEPIVAAFAEVSMNAGVVEEARVALTGVWPNTVRLADAPRELFGRPLSRDRIEAVAAAVEEEVAPQGDHRGGAAYRRAMAAVMTRRALEACAAALTAGGG